jgi:hypothetical protein
LNPIERWSVFDCSKGIFITLCFFLYDLHYKIPIELVSIGYVPMNQTTYVGYFPI